MEDVKIISWDEVYDSHRQNKSLFAENSAITVGCFDGPHLGHKALLDFVLNYSTKNNCKAGLVTFFRPTASIKNTKYAGDVSTLRLKLKKIRELGFDFIVLIDFSTEFAKIEGPVFFDILIKTIHLKYLAVGEDFVCGYRRGLGVAQLKELAPQKGFCFDSIKPVRVGDGVKISSTNIRAAVFSADFTLAKKLLDYPFLFDVIGPPWQIVDCKTIVAKRNYITQILPDCGEYAVVVNDILGNKTQAQFIVEKNEIKLVFDNVSWEFIHQNLNNFDTIEFINKE